jgi:phosphosulfolactate phosphohydrolase-like enzyme
MVVEATFVRFQTEVTACLHQCSSSKGLIGRGFAGDVEVAAACDQSACAPLLRGGAYVQYHTM